MALVESIGFRVIRHGSYMQRGYYDALRDKVTLSDRSNNLVPWPATNFVLVAQNSKK